MSWKINPAKKDISRLPNSKNISEPVSIIICTKNDIISLQQNLESILNQNYPIFEVIVVDDDSSDNSLNWLKQQEKKYTNLVLLSCKKTLPGKKKALKHGIDQAKYNWILLTDADCHTSSLFWIDEMMQARNNCSKIVLGYSPYSRGQGWLNKLIRYETSITALQYFSATSYKIPYMGVGRNIMYHKSILVNYDDVIHYDIASGDDDILVNARATSINTTSCLTKDSHIISEPEESIKAFLQQKTRHVSTSYTYKAHHKFLLILYAGSQTANLLFIVLIFSKYLLIALVFFGLRLTIIMMRSKGIFKKLVVQDLIIWTPFLDILLSLYYLLIHPLGYIINWGNNGKFVRK